jgi:hypothetical protein
MKKLLVVVLVLLMGVAALGYGRGWFSVTRGGKVDVEVDPAKFEQDKEAFSKTVGEKAGALKEKIAGLWKKTEGLTGDDKARLEKELVELEMKHERLKKLAEAGADEAEGVKQNLSKALEDVELKIEELTKKLAKGKDK